MPKQHDLFTGQTSALYHVWHGTLPGHYELDFQPALPSESLHYHSQVRKQIEHVSISQKSHIQNRRAGLGQPHSDLLGYAVGLKAQMAKAFLHL